MPPTSIPRTAVHTSDLSPDDFGLLAGKIVARTGLAGPFQLLSGTIDDYENQSQKPELVWLGGTEEDPFCVWVSYPGGAYLKLKWPTPSEDGFCQSAIDCIISDLERGGGTRERYLIPELTGPDWSIASISYGEDDTLDLSEVEGESLINLMGELNGFEDLPDDWLFSIDSGVLVLSVPHGTAITLIELGSGLEVEFEGPSFDGAPPSSLTDPLTVALAGPLDSVIEQYEELLTTYTGLLGESVEGHAGTTETAIETAYSAYTKVNVRWTDADGDPRVSYKDPANGWYHQADKFFTPVLISTGSRVMASTANVTVDLTSHGVPENARFAYVRVNLNGSAKYDTSDRLYAAEVNVDSPTFASPTSGAIRGVTAAIRMRPVTTGSETDYADATIQGKVKLDGSGDLLIEFGGNDDISLASAINVTNIYTVHLLGWSR